MNYFDRLVRRALLRPARRPGAPLADPFENVAEWPLDPPRALYSVADPHAVAAPAAPPSSITPPTAPLPSPVATRPASPVAPLASTNLAPVLPPPPEPPAVQAPGTPDEVPLADRRVLADAPDAPAVLPALEVADRFLERIGVRVPEARRIDERRAEQPPRPAPSIERANEPAPVALRHPPIIPTPPPPAVQAAEPVEVARANAAPPAGDAPPVAAARPAAARREVVVVERQSVAVESRTRPRVGAGAPHIGLGQL